MGKVARALAALLVATLLVAALLVAAPPPLAAAAAETRHAVPPGDSPAVGAPGAPVVIVEFIDYQ